MKESTVRQFSFSREELRNRLLQALEDKGIRIQGEVKLSFEEWGLTLEEHLPPVGIDQPNEEP